ncbi:hypothetical protein GBF38_016854 [Nibea albiflora]|uniref:Uncharacterized protein n=1 Tax=Nibea albiflora TaxID=240163 RepID=A0ACB7EE74_NIBAL|nr:hypothetical protein GBF38_016854 [Nibea albiflora]
MWWRTRTCRRRSPRRCLVDGAGLWKQAYPSNVLGDSEERPGGELVKPEDDNVAQLSSRLFSYRLEKVKKSASTSTTSSSSPPPHQETARTASDWGHLATISTQDKVEVKKARTEAQTSGESTAKTTPLSKDTQPEGRPGIKPAESGPTKIPDRPREDKWMRKNVPSSSLPSSSSPTMPSALQSMSESSQPSWMELAKRKSMAWSDKSMD